MTMDASTLRSIEGIGVPALTVLAVLGSTIWGTLHISGKFTELEKSAVAYRSKNDTRVSDVEKSLTDLASVVKDLTLSIREARARPKNGFDLTTCEELMLTLKVQNPTLSLPSCFELPSARRSYPEYPSWGRKKS